MTEDQLMQDLRRAKKADRISRPPRHTYKRLKAMMEKLFAELGGVESSPRVFFPKAKQIFQANKAGVEEIYWVLNDMGFPYTIAEKYAYEWAV
jgi:hypothetical protein